MNLRETGRGSRPIWVVAVIAAVLQLAIPPQISIASGTVNFMVALALVLSLSCDPSSAVYIGFASGLFFDLTSSAPIGLMTLILTVASFVVATSSHGVLGGFTTDSLRLVAIGIVAVNLINGLCLFFMGVQTNFLWALFGHGISSSILDMLAAALTLFFMGSSTTQRGFSSRSRGGRYKTLK